MRRRGSAALAVLSLSACAGIMACFDLLHSTQDVRTACEIDPTQPGCPGAVNVAEAGESVETDFCAWTPAEARQRAFHACAWLGACETPLGNNALGPCVFQALLAYDCASNPSHRVQGKTRDQWDCLQRANRCADVDACIFQRAGPPGCSSAGEYLACSEDVRIRCADGGAKPLSKARGEDCALWGKTCATHDGTTVCAGDTGGVACDASGCVGTTLRRCVATSDGGPSTDLGLDCASNGAAECVGSAYGDAAQGLACKAGGDAAAGQDDCAPNPSATCENGRATSCPSGRLESIDCATLLGSTSACSGGPLALGFDWTSPCALGAAACPNDSCEGTMLTSCARGASFSVDCKSEGLAACQMVTAEPGTAPRGACTPPP